MQENDRIEEQTENQTFNGRVPSGGCPGILHRIEQGDTLYLLGKKYQVSVAALMFANPYTDIYNLQIGDELCIPRIKMPKNEKNMNNLWAH